MDKVIAQIHGFLTLIFAFFASAIGGIDNAFSLLAVLIIVDIITGLLYAIVSKTLSSKKMKEGAIHKVIIVIMVMIFVMIDKVYIDIAGEPLKVGEFIICSRILCIAYYCIEEFISILENVANCGVPVPKWLVGILGQVSNSLNSSSTPKYIVEWFKSIIKTKAKITGIDISSDNEDSIEKTDKNCDKV